MSHQDFLDPDGWRIEDNAHGWVLRFRPPLTRVWSFLPSVYGRVPRILTSSNGIWICFFAVFAGVWGLEIYFRRTTYLQNASGALVVLLFELTRQYLFTDMALNAEQQVVARDGRFTTFAGIFPEACLRSLRLGPSQRCSGRRRLVFSGTKVPGATLVGEPGLSENAANQLLHAMLARVVPSSESAANCGPPDAMASRASSWEIASTSVAS